MSARNGIFGCGDRATEIAARDDGRPQRPKGPKTSSGIPGTNGLSERDGKIPGSDGLDGGHDRGATSKSDQALTEKCGQNVLFEL